MDRKSFIIYKWNGGTYGKTFCRLPKTMTAKIIIVFKIHTYTTNRRRNIVQFYKSV